MEALQRFVAEQARPELEDAFQKQFDKGLVKYGVPLHTFNGRDAGVDALEELVDLAVYLKQLRMEHQMIAEILLYTLCHENIDIRLPREVVTRLDAIAKGATIEEIGARYNL
jgi:hypothetical protein